MPLKNGELTLGELKRLIKQYNKLMSVDTKGMKRPELIKKIEDMGYTIDHKNAKLVGKRGVKDKQRKPANVDLPPAKPKPTKEEALKKKKEKAEKKAQERITTLKDDEVKKGIIKKVVRRKRAGKVAKDKDDKKKGKFLSEMTPAMEKQIKKQDEDEVKARKQLAEYLDKYELVKPKDKKLIDKVLREKQKYKLLSFKVRKTSNSKGPSFLISGIQYEKGRDKDPTDWSSAVNIAYVFETERK